MQRTRFLRALAALLLALALLVPGTAALAAGPHVALSPQKLTVDGRNVDCEKYNIDDYNYFKLRDLACMLSGTGSQFSVSYNKTNRTVYVVTGAAYAKQPGDLEPGEDKSATAEPSTQSIVIDGTFYSYLSVYNIGGNNYFKLAELGPILGFGVSYDKQSRTAQITSRAAATGGQAASAMRLAQTADAGRDYLDRIVFLGDSTTYGFIPYYNAGYTALPKPEQVWTPKVGYLTLPYYMYAKVYLRGYGAEYSIADAAALVQPELMVVTLGIDGIALVGETDFVAVYKQLIGEIREASPDTKIILNSIYPVADSYKYQGDINNDKINAANTWIERIAVDLGLPFLYSWEALAVNGKLPETAHNGDGLHLTGESLTKIADYVRTHAYS